MTMSPARRHTEVILAGSGGQGLILSGILLAEAAMNEGRNVVQTQSYGIASRGGLSLAEVIGLGEAFRGQGVPTVFLYVMFFTILCISAIAQCIGILVGYWRMNGNG